MFNVRFKDRKELQKFDLNVEIFDKFNLKVKDVIPLRKIFILDTNDGYKILKRIDYSIEELEFINSGLNYIRKTFDRVMRYIPTKENKNYLLWNNDIYCILDFVDGRECEYSNPLDVALTSKALGELHKASEGFKGNIDYKNTCGVVIDEYKRALEEIEIFKSMANLYQGKGYFNKIFLENVDHYKKQIQTSIKILEESAYLKLCGEQEKVAFCHNDLAYHNIIINSKKVYFIDFDYAVIDLKVRDICNFANKVMGHSDYDISKYELILESYCKSNKLDDEELIILGGLMYFPQAFYSISKNYYTRKKEWNEDVFSYRLNKKIQFEEFRSEFLQELKSNINNKSKISC